MGRVRVLYSLVREMANLGEPKRHPQVTQITQIE